MATTYRIHPAIGIARVGDSPDDFFVGPEIPGDHPDPPGGFKDGDCRVKRQAARFRIFAHHDDSSVEEITDADAEIRWTVHLANAKAPFGGRNGGSPDVVALTIDPGPRTATGPDQRHLFDSGTITFGGASTVSVPLGEIRTDDESHLLVLGGHGAAASPVGNGIVGFWANAGWYDDVSDGPVTASITLRGSGTSPTVEPAWVIVGPPKFAPHQDSVTTLYDRLQQRMIDLGLLAAPTTTSYTHDVHPILQRARDMRWVEGILGAHSWPDPVMNQSLIDAIMARISAPGGASPDMPRLSGSDAALTVTQYAHLQRWQSGSCAADWAGPPVPSATVTPDGLDRAALEACVGGAFFPGIEAGGLSAGSRPILESAYAAPFRLDHSALAPGGISASMALPWHADFKACGDNWWPVPRPNDVLPQGSASSVRWDRGVASMDDMVTGWKGLGFVVRQGAQKVEVQHCAETSILLLTPHLDFVDVPQGPMAMVREVPLAIAFEVMSTGAAVTLEYAPGGGPTHPQLVAVSTSDTVGPTSGSGVATARLWIVFRTGAAGSAIPTQTVTVRNAADHAQTWQVTIDGSTVPRRTTATSLVLDRSGSMSEDRGDGQTKHVALQQAAGVLVDLLLAGDGVGVVRYNQDAQALQAVLPLGDGGLSDANRTATQDVIDGTGLDPQGATSIGDGLFEGRAQLTAATGSYDGTALLVLTDGMENSPRWIADVAGQIDATTYAIGFGTAQNTSAPALQALSGNTGGYLLVTGAITGDNRFLLQKYFLQILAGISAAEVVLDPDGVLTPGEVHRIPFTVSDADSGVEVVLLTPRPDAVDFRLQTPNGLLLEPWRARSEPAMRFETGDGMAYYRIALPTQLVPGRFDQAGTWHVVMTLGKPRSEPTQPTGRQDDPAAYERAGTDVSILQPHPPAHGRRALDDPTHRRRLLEHERAFALAQDATGVRADVGAGGRADAPTGTAASVSRRRLPYSVVVHAYSSVSLRAEVEQSGFEPGASVTVVATVTQSGLPTADAAVRAEVTRPDGTTVHLDLEPAEPGTYVATFAARPAGVHRVRVLARGRTRAALPWTRERTLTAAVWRGGDKDAATPPGQGGTGTGDDKVCHLVACLLDGLGDGRLAEQLKELGVDLDHVRRCWEKGCAGHQRDELR